MDLLLAAAGQPWIYGVVALGCLVDGFFPPFPSEALVVGLASLAATQGIHQVGALLVAAVVGTFLGDNLAYALGRRMGTTRFRWMRRPFMQRSLAKAGRELNSRPVSMVLVARFIPGARVAVNLTAGASGYPRGKFVAVSTLSATLWAGYSVAIGALAGGWFRENPLWGFIAAIVAAGLLGLVLDKVSGMVRARKRRPSAGASAPVPQLLP
jgi:membrane protein DedA with SNARE-associated domain